MYQIHFQIGLSDTRLPRTSLLNKIRLGEQGEPACLIPLGTSVNKGHSGGRKHRIPQHRLNSGFVLMNVNIYYQRRCAPRSDRAFPHVSSCLLPSQVPNAMQLLFIKGAGHVAKEAHSWLQIFIIKHSRLCFWFGPECI